MQPLRILAHELASPSFFSRWVLVSGAFFLFSLALINLQTLLNFALSDYAFATKVRILFQLYIGALQAISKTDTLLIGVVSVLFGLNFIVVLQKIDFLRKRGHLRFTLGAGLVSLIASGCASCGLSVASIVGLTGALVLLPFGGIELYGLAIALLTASLFYNLRTIYRACKIR